MSKVTLIREKLIVAFVYTKNLVCLADDASRLPDFSRDEKALIKLVYPLIYSNFKKLLSYYPKFPRLEIKFFSRKKNFVVKMFVTTKFSKVKKKFTLQQKVSKTLMKLHVVTKFHASNDVRNFCRIQYKLSS